MSKPPLPQHPKVPFGELPPQKPVASGRAKTALIFGLVALVALATLLLVVFGALLIPAIGSAREAARRSMSSGHLKQIGVAVHNYNDMFASIPMTGTPDPAAGGHLSWRVRLLPHIEQRAMFNQVDFSKPWDAAPNTQFHDQMPSTYGQPGKETERSKTQYLVFTHDGPVNVAPPGQLVRLGETWFHPKRGRRLRDCMDGTTNTIMAVEADPERAVPWMKPADLSLDPQNPKAGIGNYRNGGFLVVMGDGSVRFISNKIDNQTMLSLILCNEGQEVDLESLDPRSK